MKVGDYIQCKKNYPENYDKPAYVKNKKYKITRVYDDYLHHDGYDIVDEDGNSYHFLLTNLISRHYLYDVFYKQEELRNKKLKSL
ncbi:hypothetical protein M0Q50_03355 [bacterium]|jgi:hypothetical protein|nr:hypothetical protein [bacterium]